MTTADPQGFARLRFPAHAKRLRTLAKASSPWMPATKADQRAAAAMYGQKLLTVDARGAIGGYSLTPLALEILAEATAAEANGPTNADCVDRERCPRCDCFRVSYDRGSFAVGRGYTSRQHEPRGFCATRHIQGCPSPLPWLAPAEAAMRPE